MKLTGKSVLITGGAGFIGSHLVDRVLQENPSNLVVVDNFYLGREENLEDAVKVNPGLKVFRLDAADLAAMRDLVEAEKVDVVFNLAVIPLPTSLKYPAWTVTTNVNIALTFCELARWGAIGTLIHSSSSEAYGSAQYVPMDEGHPLHPRTPYAASKSAGDQLVQSYWRTFNMDVSIVRPFNNFGPRQNPGTFAGIIPIVVQRVLHKQPIEIHGDGEQTRDYIFVRDTANAFVHVYEEAATRGKVLNIATGQEITMNQLVARLLEVMGVPDYPVTHSQQRPGDVRRHCGDIRLAHELIGFEPPVISEADLRETVDYYLKRFS